MEQMRPRRVLLIATTWWSGPSKLAVVLAEHGWELEALCPSDHPFFYTKSICRIYPYRGMHALESLLDAVSQSGASELIPCDDGAVRQLHEIYEERAELRPLIERSLGAAAGFVTVGSRAGMAALVDSLGIRCPRTAALRSKGDLPAWFKESGSGVI